MDPEEVAAAARVVAAAAALPVDEYRESEVLRPLRAAVGALVSREM